MNPADLRDAVAGVLRTFAWHRRLVAGALAAVAVAAGLSAVSPKPARTLAVWVAARDLSGGAPVAARDVVLRGLPLDAVPGGALGSGVRILGRLLAAPVRRGEPLTDVRLLGPSLLSALDRPGLVAVPVRVADGSAAAALVHAGDVVDVLASSDASGGSPDAIAATVAVGVRVLAVPARDEAGGDTGGLVVVAATHAQAAALARASAATRLSLALQRP